MFLEGPFWALTFHSLYLKPRIAIASQIGEPYEKRQCPISGPLRKRGISGPRRILNTYGTIAARPYERYLLNLRRLRMMMSLVSAAHATLEAFEKRDKREGSIKKKCGGRRANESFEKRKRGLLRKCNKTVELYNADLYIVVRRKGKCTVYSSCFVSTWPPHQEDIVSFYPLHPPP